MKQKLGLGHFEGQTEQGAFVVRSDILRAQVDFHSGPYSAETNDSSLRMPRPRRIDPELVAQARMVVVDTCDVKQLRAAQSILLPALVHATLEQTAALLGVGRASVPRLQRRFRKGLQPTRVTLQWGGRRRAMMTVEEEKAFLSRGRNRPAMRAYWWSPQCGQRWPKNWAGRMVRPRQCWAPAPLRPAIDNGYERQFVYVYGAAGPLEGRLDWRLCREMNTARMGEFLAQVSQARPTDLIAMVFGRGQFA